MLTHCIERRASLSWIEELYKTYESCTSLVGEPDDSGYVLLPIAHSTQNAQIEVVISLKGDFLRASLLDKEHANTIIPVTEDSGTRSSGIAPHPLHDKLIYVAGDYGRFVKKEKVNEYYNEYMNQLYDWSYSLYGTESLKAVYTYLKKSTLIEDLVNNQILHISNGLLDSKVKLQKTIIQEDAFVRFRVDDINLEDAFWKNKNIYDSFISYYLNKFQKVDLCYINGDQTAIGEKHPSKIRNAADKAKLISANDTSGFTYRGRFDDKTQVVTIGYKTSQKAHNALRWLLQKQGYCRDGVTLVVWENRLKKIPNLMEDTSDAFIDLEDDFFSDMDQEIEYKGTAEQYAYKLNKAIAGYKQTLDEVSKVIVISVDAATPGRLSIVYYRELDGSNFLEHVRAWHSIGAWKHAYKRKDNQKISFIGTPAPRDIILAAFGTEQNGLLKVTDQLMKCSIERILPCIIEGARIPYDLINALYNRVLCPISMESYNWEKVLSITCSMLVKYRLERFKEVWSMNVDENENSYSYVCGRMLAVADAIEAWALREMNQNRPTNAMKYFNPFAKNPNRIWGIINKNLNPYINKLGYRSKYLLELKEELSSLIPPEKFGELKNLDGRFVLGFDCQRRQIRIDMEKRKLSKFVEKDNLDKNDEENE